MRINNNKKALYKEHNMLVFDNSKCKRCVRLEDKYIPPKYTSLTKTTFTILVFNGKVFMRLN